MTGDVRVVEDGVEETSRERPSQGPSWFWLGVGFVIGLGLAVVFFTAGADQPVAESSIVTFPEADQAEEPSPTETATTIAGAEGVAEVIEGFPDTVVAATQVSAASMAHLIWPLSGPPITSPLAGFSTSSVKFDLSGRMLATASRVTEGQGALLSLGTPLRLSPLTSDVSGYAWHDSERALLSYTHAVNGERQLWVVDASLEPELIARGVAIDGTMEAWGHWGFALQGEGSVTVLTPTGEPATVIQGRFLDSSADGRFVVEDGGLALATPSGEVVPFDLELGRLGELETAQFSPDGSKIVVVGGAGHMIIPLVGDREPIYAPVTSGYPQLAWSSDSRFVVSPWIRGILVIDTEQAGKSHTALTRHTIVAVATVPLSGS